MKKYVLWFFGAVFVAPAVVAAPAGGFDSGKLFLGAGLSQNDVSGSDEGTGYQFFGGYRFGQIASNIELDAEVGYMDTGDMDINRTVLGIPVTVDARAKGLWATAVGRLALDPQFDLIGRLGMDFGDDDGLMFGVGAGYNVSKQTQLRLELVERDEVSSLQVNFVYRP